MFSGTKQMIFVVILQLLFVLDTSELVPSARTKVT